MCYIINVWEAEKGIRIGEIDFVGRLQLFCLRFRNGIIFFHNFVLQLIIKQGGTSNTCKIRWNIMVFNQILEKIILRSYAGKDFFPYPFSPASSLFLPCSLPLHGSVTQTGDNSRESASIPRPDWLTELFQFIGASTSIEWIIYGSNSSLAGRYFLNCLILHVINF